MGCLQLHIEPLPSLRVIHRKKEIKPKKSEGSYYPFGLKHKGYNYVRNIGIGNPTAQKFGYVERELEESLDLNMYEMDWRQYDPAVGRFFGIDKLSEVTQNFTPYHYGNNNPIFFKDPTGLFSTVVNEDGVVTDHNKDDGDSNIYLNSRNGEVLGQEEEGKEYRKGDKIFNVDSSNPDYSLYTYMASATSTAMTIAIPILKAPRSIDVYDETGKLIGKWLTRLKVPFRALKLVNGVLEAAGPIGDVASIGFNTIDWKNGKMTNRRFAFNSIGTGASLYAWYVGAGPAGVGVGGTVYLGNLMLHASDVSRKETRGASAQEKHGYKIRSTNIFSKSFWNEVGGYLNMSGMSGIKY